MTIQLTPEILDTIERVLASIAKKHTFGIYDVEDIKQEGFLLALDLLKKYEGTGPLENFLRVSLNNLLINFRHSNSYDFHQRCGKCTKFSPECEDCVRRHTTQIIKKNLLQPIDLDGVKPDGESNLMSYDPTDSLELKETMEKINRTLPVGYRADYLRMKEGLYVSRTRRAEIESIIGDILNE